MVRESSPLCFAAQYAARMSCITRMLLHRLLFYTVSSTHGSPVALALVVLHYACGRVTDVVVAQPQRMAQLMGRCLPDVLGNTAGQRHRGRQAAE
jgi:hypothetical protein